MELLMYLIFKWNNLLINDTMPRILLNHRLISYGVKMSLSLNNTTEKQRDNESTIKNSNISFVFNRNVSLERFLN